MCAAPDDYHVYFKVDAEIPVKHHSVTTVMPAPSALMPLPDFPAKKFCTVMSGKSEGGDGEEA